MFEFVNKLEESTFLSYFYCATITNQINSILSIRIESLNTNPTDNFFLNRSDRCRPTRWTHSFIIDGLAAGKETYHEEETQYSLEEALEYLRDFLCELKELNGQIIENGNTPELLEEVYKKYTELWLFQLYFYVDSLPRVIGGLSRYPNDE